MTGWFVVGSVHMHLQSVEPAPQLWLRACCSKTQKNATHIDKAVAIFGATLCSGDVTIHSCECGSRYETMAIPKSEIILSLPINLRSSNKTQVNPGLEIRYFCPVTYGDGDALTRHTLSRHRESPQSLIVCNLRENQHYAG